MFKVLCLIFAQNVALRRSFETDILFFLVSILVFFSSRVLSVYVLTRSVHNDHPF